MVRPVYVLLSVETRLLRFVHLDISSTREWRLAMMEIKYPAMDATLPAE